MFGTSSTVTFELDNLPLFVICSFEAVGGNGQIANKNVHGSASWYSEYLLNYLIMPQQLFVHRTTFTIFT